MKKNSRRPSTSEFLSICARWNQYVYWPYVLSFRAAFRRLPDDVDALSRLEQESGFFFNMKYFEDQVQGGEWEEVERYLSGFTKVDDNRYSMKIFFEIRKQKYLEALDK